MFLKTEDVPLAPLCAGGEAASYRVGILKGPYQGIPHCFREAFFREEQMEPRQCWRFKLIKGRVRRQ